MTGQPEEQVDPGTVVSAEQERARALAAVLRDQNLKVEAARQAEARRVRRARVRRGALLATWLSVAYVWLASPSWLQVESPPTPTVQDETDALRVNVFLQSQRIEAYRLSRGRLPYVLEEAGPPLQGMEYRRRDNRYYELRGRSNRVFLRYLSEESPLDFVGDAARILDPESASGHTKEGQ